MVIRQLVSCMLIPYRKVDTFVKCQQPFVEEDQLIKKTEQKQAMSMVFGIAKVRADGKCFIFKGYTPT